MIQQVIRLLSVSHGHHDESPNRSTQVLGWLAEDASESRPKPYPGDGLGRSCRGAHWIPHNSHGHTGEITKCSGRSRFSEKKIRIGSEATTRSIHYRDTTWYQLSSLLLSGPVQKHKCLTTGCRCQPEIPLGGLSAIIFRASSTSIRISSSREKHQLCAYLDEFYVTEVMQAVFTCFYVFGSYICDIST